LAYLNAAEVDGGRDFRQHMERLTFAIDRILKGSEPPPLKRSRRWIPLALAGAGCLLLIAIGVWAYPSILAYINSKSTEKVVVNPTPVPPPPAPAPQPAPPAFSAADCKPQSASFYDDFHRQDPGWNFTSDDPVRYDQGQLVVVPKPNSGFTPKYLSLRFQNATICAHVQFPRDVKAPDDASGGVVFWAANNSNLYVAMIRPDGGYWISRLLAGTWINLIRSKSDQIKTGLGAVNEIKVELIDNFGALFINNTKIQEFRGQPPSGGGAIGLRGESELSQANEWRFLDLAVMDNGSSKLVSLPSAPSGPTIADCRPDNVGDFQDTFAKPDPAWQLNTKYADYADGQLAIKLDENTNFVQLYRSLVFKNATVCLTMKSPPAIADLEDVASGGLAFWSIDYRNYYLAKIYPNGSFTIFRKLNDEWIPVVNRTPSEAIKKGVGAVNEIQVVLNGNNGLLYINGTQVSEFRGNPPPTGGAVGVYAQTEAHRQNDWRFLKIAVVQDQ